MGTFQLLSMGWVYAAPGLLGALVILYFLKLKRREVTVGSTFLWRRAIDDMRVNSPLQRLRMNILLLLQALALLLLILALARPVSSIGGLEGTDSIVLIDVSASMQATDGKDDGKTTRFERALEEARRIVRDLSRGDRAIIIAFADEARVLTPLTDAKATLEDALDALAPTDRGTRLDAAIHRVRALIGGAERVPELFVLTDGRVGPLEGVALESKVPLHYVKVGSATENVGIVGLDVRAPATIGDATRVFVTVANTGAKPVEIGLDLKRDGKLLGSREAKLQPGAVQSVPFEVSVESDAVVQAVTVTIDHGPAGPDALPADDVAYGLLRPQEPVRILLVTTGNLFLDSALREDPLVWKDARGQVPVMLPEAFAQASVETIVEHDLVVLDRMSPKELPPGDYLCFASLPPFPGLEDLGSKSDWKVLDWDEAHDAARFVNFSTLLLPSAEALKKRDADVEIVRGNHGPIVLEARDGDRRALIVNFDLMSLPLEGAWTFDPSYPIFLANAVRYLGGSGRDRKDLLVRTGGLAELRFPATAAVATVDPPQAEPYDVEIRPGDDLVRVPGLDRAGIYSVAFKTKDKPTPLRTTLFAANVADVEESTIAPAPSLEVAGKLVAGADKAIESNRDMWKLAAALGLLFVLVEWWVYNRRVFI